MRCGLPVGNLSLIIILEISMQKSSGTGAHKDKSSISDRAMCNGNRHNTTYILSESRRNKEAAALDLGGPPQRKILPR